MGVIPCDRAGCPNIMCDRYSRTYGRLCWKCFEELVRRGINTDIGEFMEEEEEEQRYELDAHEFFNREFPLRSSINDY